MEVPIAAVSSDSEETASIGTSSGARFASMPAELAQRCPNLVGEERHWVQRVFEFGRLNADSTPEQVELASAHARASRNRSSFGDWEKDERRHLAATEAEALAQTEEEKGR
jgi:hypothetical protein